MSEHELDKLLGGFAADTLTPEERQKLFTAALQDQQLFNALADEQALRELLADPVVRRRLLQTLNQTGASGAGGSLSWLGWLRRPATLAYAGGLAVAVFAVVLGTKVYQESLRQTALPVATEDTKAAAPPSAAPQASQPAEPSATVEEPKANVNVRPAAEPAKKDGLKNSLAEQEKVAPSKLAEDAVSVARRDDLRRRTEQDGVREQVPVPKKALKKPLEQAAGSADKPAANLSPPGTASESKTPKTQANAPAPAAGAQAVGARALFYAETAAHSTVGTMAQEQRPAMTPSSEPAQRAERQLERFALSGKSDGSAHMKPLGLRYSFVVGAAGEDREVEATTAARHPEPISLAVETNQDAYLQVWRQADGETPQLLVPQKETGQISLRIPGGQRQQLLVPAQIDMLTLRVSRTPFGPITKQETFALGRPSPGQIQETVMNEKEKAGYIVNQDLTPTAQIAVEIPLHR